ncbi:MAG TPA: PAS domain S-box protein [Spirochaetota bacterium]|nr:PAS domain S-box protein [Spirochaetota bacterium]
MTKYKYIRWIHLKEYIRLKSRILFFFILVLLLINLLFFMFHSFFIDDDYLRIIPIGSSFVFLLLTGCVFYFIRDFWKNIGNLIFQMITVMDNAPTLIYMKDREGRYLFVNRAWAQIINISYDDVLGKSDKEIFPEIYASELIKNDQEVFDKVDMIEFEEKIEIDGIVHTYKTLKYPIKDEKNNVVAICGLSTDISERKLADKALAESEIKYKNIIEFAPDAFFHGDAHGNFLNVNIAAEILTGYSRDELLKMNMKDLFDERELLEKPLRYDLLDTGAILKKERHIRRKDGLLLTVEMISRKMADGTYQSFFRDITDREKTQEQLKETETIFSHFLANSPVYVFFKDENIRAIYLSKNYENMLGMPLEDILGKTMDEIFPSDLAKGMIEDDKRVLQKGEIVSVDEELNGRYYTTIKFPLAIGDKKYLAGYTLDITERVLSKKQVEEERGKLFVTLRSIGDAVITTDADCNITLMNPTAEALTGWSLDAAMGKPLWDVIRIKDRNTGLNCCDIIKEILSQKNKVFPEETILVKKNGEELYIENTLATIKIKESIIGLVIVFRDVSIKLKTDKLLQNAQKLESLGVLAGGIAHDFNNLLAGIFGYLELIKIYALNSELQKITSSADKALSVMSRAKFLTQQLLTFARGGAPQKSLLNINDILESSVDVAFNGTGVIGELDVSTGLWSCSADKAQFCQVIDNLLINSIQSMPNGGVVTVEAENFLNKGDKKIPSIPEGEYIKISVKDNGIGIPSEIMPRLFDPFFTTKKDHTGLGLSIAYSIVTRHGGTIVPESDGVSGSTFSIYFPSDSGKDRKYQGDSAEGYGKFQGRVLVMDDEPFVLETTEKILSSLGFSVDTARNGNEAIEMYMEAKDKEPFTLLILDLTIKGGMGGQETLDYIRKIDSSVLAIAASGYSSLPVMSDPSSYGFIGKLEKPYKIEDMVELIKDIYESGRVN